MAAEWDAENGVWKGERAVDSADFQIPEPLWVFGYGSLCWRIDDPFEEKFDGYVTGWRRRVRYLWQLVPIHGNLNASRSV